MNVDPTSTAERDTLEEKRERRKCRNGGKLTVVIVYGHFPRWTGSLPIDARRVAPDTTDLKHRMFQ